MQKILGGMTRFNDATYERRGQDYLKVVIPKIYYQNKEGDLANKVVAETEEIVTINMPSLITPLSLYDKRTQYTVLEFDPLLDSANMNMGDWVKIAHCIEVLSLTYNRLTTVYLMLLLSFMEQTLWPTQLVH